MSPGFPWLGHNHVDSSYYHRHENAYQPISTAFQVHYGPEWNLNEMIESRNIRRAHSSLQAMDMTEATYQTAAFIQSWLYFGLLESILSRPIPTSYMVRISSDGKACLYSRTLPILLEVWYRRLSVVEADFRDEALRKARECAVDASSILCNIMEDVSKDGCQAVFLELKTLLSFFEPAISALCEAIAGFTEAYLHLEVRSFSTPVSFLTKAYSESLIRKGWCRFVVASAEISMSPSLLRFVDAAGFASNSIGHEHCTADQCERNFIQVETYTQRHWRQKCRCRFWRPDLVQVFEILDAGYIPVVQMDANGRSLQLGGVNPSDRKWDYIAFSHVWADGLGSSTETGLPNCQIRRLHQLASSRLTYGAWFWIDGLCIPNQRPYRGKAIELMRLTYQNATGVIVLDEGCRKLSINNSDLEIGWSVFASGWFGRLWTYQEGFLPPWVDIELGDGLIDLYTLVQKLHNVYKSRNASPFPAVFVRDLVAVLQKARPLDSRHLERPWSRRMVDLFNAMTRRRSSRPDDQILLLGLLLDLDIGI